MKLETPKNVTELKRVIGIINYLGRFAKDLSTTIKLLTDLPKIGVQWRWDIPDRDSFDTVKIISELPSLSFYSAESPTIGSADSSSHDLGVTLNGDLQPVVFASSMLMSSEQRYSQTEK